MVFILIFLDVSVSGFLLSVSPIKVSNGKVKYIHFLKRTQGTLHRGICFSAAKHLHIYICTYLKLLTPLVQIHLITELHLYQIYLHLSLSGYLSEVSPKKHALFNNIYKDDNNTGIENKRCQSSENSENIIVFLVKKKQNKSYLHSFYYYFDDFLDLCLKAYL